MEFPSAIWWLTILEGQGQDEGLMLAPLLQLFTAPFCLCSCSS